MEIDLGTWQCAFYIRTPLSARRTFSERSIRALRSRGCRLLVIEMLRALSECNRIISDAVLRYSPWRLHSLRVVIALQRTDRSGDRFALMRRAPSGVDGLPDEQVLRKLLTLDAAAVARDHPEAGVQQSCDRLNRVQFTVAVERKPNDVTCVLLMPRDARTGVYYSLRCFRKYLVQQRPSTRQHHPLAQIGAHVQRHAFVAAIAVAAAHLLGIAIARRGRARGTAAAELTGRRRTRRGHAHRRRRAVFYALLLHLFQLPAHCCKRDTQFRRLMQNGSDVEEKEDVGLREMSKYRASSSSRSRSAKLSGISSREFRIKFNMCRNIPPSLSMK